MNGEDVRTAHAAHGRMVMVAYASTELYQRLHAHLESIRVVDTHEHLQQADQFLPAGEVDVLDRFFNLLVGCDLVSAGIPPADRMTAVNPRSGLSLGARWALMEPWVPLAVNTAYFEVLRIAARDIFGVDDLFTADGIERVNAAMQREVNPAFTRRVFDRANIDFAMNNPFGSALIFRHTPEPETLLVDMHDQFTEFPIAGVARDAGIDILCLDDYLRAIDIFFERYGRIAGAYKVGRAYDRILEWEDVPHSAVEPIFLRLLAFNDRPGRREMKALEDYVLHYLVRKCGEYGLRMKFHCGHQEGNANDVRHARPALLIPLFMKYPRTNFDIYHIGYPYHEEATSIVKTFPNVTINFCWAFLANMASARQALYSMLDTVPASKIHGFGGDYLVVECSYAHLVITRREIARVLCMKVEEGRFSEEQAANIGAMLLRDNALRNFDLPARRAAYSQWVVDRAAIHA